MQYISDIIDVYPGQLDKNFQGIISSKKEFNRFKSGPREKPRDGFYNHQKLTHQILTIIDNLAVFSETGTGKSREVLGFIEKVLKEFDNEKMGRPYDERLSRFSRAMIFVPGDAQKSEIRKQLVCGLNPSYITDEVINAKDEKNRNNAIKRILRDAGYEIQTYRKFSNYIRNNYPNASDNYRLARDFADTIFWVDEAHNLTSPDREDQESTYEAFHRLFHTALRSKFIVSTATPMINSVDELRLLLNLILPITMPLDFNYKDIDNYTRNTFFRNLPRNINLNSLSREEASRYFTGQIPNNFNFNTASDEEIEPYLRGRCVYIRALDTGAVPVYMGEPMNQESYDAKTGKTFIATTVTYQSTMSRFQSESYMNMNDRRAHDIYQAEIQKSNFVFPDGSIEVKNPNRGFDRFVERSYNKFSAKPELKKYISTMDGIYSLGCKIGEIVDMCKNLPDKDFVYTPYIELGVIPLALCLEAQGFKRFTETSSVFVDDVSSDDVQPYCEPPGKKERLIRPDFRKIPRYAVLIGETSEREREVLIETFNSYENRHGDLIKAIIVSRVGRDGINLSDVKRGHLLNSGWNDAVNYQARSRIVRATSHENLLQEIREELIRQGLDPADARFEIELYNHVAIAYLDGVVESIDNQMYLTAEAKDRETHRVLRLIKRAAIGCRINYDRNVRPTDKDYSQQCDYDVCSYECFSEVYDDDYSTYDIRYGSELLPIIIEKLRLEFMDRKSFSVDEITEALDEYRDVQIIEALMKMIDENLSVMDRFGGVSWVRRSGDKFYLVKDIRETSPLGNIYLDPVLLEERDIKNVVEEMDIIDLEDIIPRLTKLFNEGRYVEFDKQINKLSIESQAIVLEDAVSKYYSGDDSNYVNYILNRYRRMIFSFNQPITEINQLRYNQVQNTKKRGKKPRDVDKVKVRNYKDVELKEIVDRGGYEDPDGDPLVAHILYSQSVDRTKYSKTARFNKAEGRIRIYNIKDNVWSDVPTFEVPVYNKLIQIKNYEKIRHLEEKGIYGIKDLDGTFRIRNRLMEQKGAEENGRKVKRGKECNTWNRRELIDIMYEIGVDLRNLGPEVNLEGTERQELVNYLLDNNVNKTRDDLSTWSDQRLLYYTYWYHNWLESDRRKPVRDICDYIETRMEETDLMAYT